MFFAHLNENLILLLLMVGSAVTSSSISHIVLILENFSIWGTGSVVPREGSEWTPWPDPGNLDVCPSSKHFSASRLCTLAAPLAEIKGAGE